MAFTRFNYDDCRTKKKLQESTGPGNEFLDFVRVNEYEQSIGEYGDSVTEISDAPITKVISSYKRVSSSYSTYTIPKYTIPIRIFGNPDVIDSDQAWAAFFRRASDSASNQLSVTTTRYEDHSFTLAMPYTQYNANVLASKYQTCNAVEISYDYNLQDQSWHTSYESKEQLQSKTAACSKDSLA